VQTDPHGPPTLAIKQPTAAVRTGAAHCVAVGGAWTANDTEMAAAANECWEDAPAFAAEGMAHDDTAPLAGDEGLCSGKPLHMGADGITTAWSLTKTCPLRRKATTQ